MASLWYMLNAYVRVGGFSINPIAATPSKHNFGANKLCFYKSLSNSLCFLTDPPCYHFPRP